MSYFQDYLTGVKALIDQVSEVEVERLVQVLVDAWKADKRVLLFGNGGSSATASHIVNDLQKCIHLEAARPLKALCLSDCTPLVMAWANDTEFANVFAPELQIELPADVLVLSHGRVPENALHEPLTAVATVPIITAGDCCSPRGLEEAILEGTLAARNGLQLA